MIYEAIQILGDKVSLRKTGYLTPGKEGTGSLVVWLRISVLQRCFIEAYYPLGLPLVAQQ